MICVVVLPSLFLTIVLFLFLTIIQDDGEIHRVAILLHSRSPLYEPDIVESTVSFQMTGRNTGGRRNLYSRSPL